MTQTPLTPPALLAGGVLCAALAASGCVGSEGVAGAPRPALVLEGLPPGPPPPRAPMATPDEVGFRLRLTEPMDVDTTGLSRALARHPLVVVEPSEDARTTDAARRLLEALTRELEPAAELKWASAPARPAEDPRLFDMLRKPEGPRGEVSIPVSWASTEGVTLRVWSAPNVESFTTSACEPTLAAWGEAQRYALSRLQPYLDHVDASLLYFYRRELRRRSQRGAWRSVTGEDEARGGACVRAWNEVVAAEARCAADETLACSHAPRVHLVGDLRVGVPAVSAFRDGACTRELGFDPRAALLDVARTAAEAVGETTSSAWAEQAQRTALLGELAAIVEDACEPAPRVDDATIHARVERRLRALGSAWGAAPSLAEGTRWQLHDDTYTLATGEAMEQVSRLSVDPESPADRMEALLASLRDDVAAATACGRDEWGAGYYLVLSEGERVTWISRHPTTTSCPNTR